MADQSLRGYLQLLELNGELVRIDKPVDPMLNMAAIEWRVYKELKKASLFTNITGHPGWRACSQIFADRRKWAIAMGVEEDRLLETLSSRLTKPIDAVTVSADGAAVKQRRQLGAEVDLLSLPTMLVSERDGGRYIASGIAITRDPETQIRNVSVHRQQVKGKDMTGFVMAARHTRRIYDKYSLRNEAMPVAIVVGAHPAIFFGAAFTTAYGLDELSLAGALLNDPVRLVKCETNDLEVPADAELVIEGEILPNNYMEMEGPFGEVPGTYCAVGESHVMKVKAITMRNDPIFYGIHCGFPETDTQAVTALGIEVATLEHMRRVEGGLDLMDVRCLTVSGLMMIVIKLRPKAAGQAKTALMAALSGPYLHPKIAIAVDDDIDTSDLSQIIWSIATRVHADRDLTLIPNTRVFVLDNVSPIEPGDGSFQRLGTKWLIDATKGPVTRPSERAIFDKAMPPNYDTVRLADFL